MTSETQKTGFYWFSLKIGQFVKFLREILGKCNFDGFSCYKLWMTGKDDPIITDVAVRKRYQRLDEILIFFTSTIREITKVVYKESSVSNAHIYNKRMLYETHASIASSQAYAARTGLRQVSRAYCMTEFFYNNFADFLDEVGVKIIQILSSRWWRLLTATSAISCSHLMAELSIFAGQEKNLKGGGNHPLW